MTLDDFIRANSLLNPAGVSNLIECWTQPGFGADPRELSLLFVLWYVACSGNESNVGTFSRNSDTATAPRSGASSAARSWCRCAWPSSSATSSRCSAPVTQVEHRDRRVHVHTGRGTVDAQRVIVGRSAAAGARHRLVPAAAGAAATRCSRAPTWAS